MNIALVFPTPAYKEQLLAYKQAFLDAGETMHGCAGLETAASFEEWYENVCRNRYEESVAPGLVPATTFLGVEKATGEVVGMIDVRHRLNDYLLGYGGHIGYSVGKSKRRQGYGSQMLLLALEECRRRGISRVLITCDSENAASARVIEKCGGVLENRVPDGAGVTCRYWIALSEEEIKKRSDF